MRDVVALDVGGVLLTDLTSQLLKVLARVSGRDQESVREAYSAPHVRRSLWTGEISTAEFWARLGDALDVSLAPQEWDERCVGITVRLMDAHFLETVLASGQVGLLTNHRAEWLWPTLARFGLTDAFSPVVVSGDVRALKPERAIYTRFLEAARSGYDRALFVDDKPEHLPPAEEAGFQSLHADAGGQWQAKLSAWLG